MRNESFFNASVRRICADNQCRRVRARRNRFARTAPLDFLLPPSVVMAMAIMTGEASRVAGVASVIYQTLIKVENYGMIGVGVRAIYT